MFDIYYRSFNVTTVSSTFKLGWTQVRLYSTDGDVYVACPKLTDMASFRGSFAKLHLTLPLSEMGILFEMFG